MSTLGKILTVLNVVAAISLCVLAVGFVKSSEELKNKSEQQFRALDMTVKARDALKNTVRIRNSEYDKMVLLNQQDIDNKRNAIEALRARNVGLDREKRQLEKQLNDLKVALQGLDTSLKGLRAEKARLDSAYKKQISDSTVLRQVNSDLKSRNQDLRQAVLDLRARVRGLEVQISESHKENTYLKQHTKVELPNTVPVLPTVPLNGVIREVDNETNVAEISLGSSDQVVENMKFVVYRGNDYLADLVITKVDENSAVGRLEVKQTDVRRDDNVTYAVRK
ncbi:MAG: hypothetical protein GWP05_09445 [Anaerolineaceae bacterium]|nr:hypothetical protein [Anaerolineaceae bacterium]